MRMYLFPQCPFMIKVRPQNWIVIKYLRGVFENVHISIFIPFNSLKIWEKGFWKCTHSVLSFIVGNISVGFAAQWPSHLHSKAPFSSNCIAWYSVMVLLFVSSVRSSNSHPDLLVTQHPLFQITPVLNTGLSLSEPLQLYKGYNAI